VPSRYVVKAPSFDGESNIFYNIRNGIGIKVPKSIAGNFKELSDIPALTPIISKYGFLGSLNEADDLHKEYIRKKQHNPFHLIILPHQNCNFRCVYCYERFDKNKMSPSIEQALIQLAENRLKSKRHKVFSVSWFGGEPLLAPDVIERLSKKFIQLSNSYDVKYIAGITTNGYELNTKNIEMLINNGVKHFQITVDGTMECHDHQRIMIGGQPTYNRIISNMIDLSKREENFKVIIRMNVGPDNLKYVDDHIRNMKELFGQDKRFVLYFHNIGHWGGTGDSNVKICSENMTIKLLNLTLDYEMNADSEAIRISPDSTCYAASENSFVVGVDGMVYKCTVALYDNRNHVGMLKDNGELELDEVKMNLWTQSGIEDNGCKECFFAPSCHGDSCPLVRIEKRIRPCPDQKKKIKDYITLMDRQGSNFIKIKRKEVNV